MQINALRKELAALLNSRPTGRTPALRRSRKDEWLYATDAAALFLPEEREKLLAELSRASWESMEEDGWILLRKIAAEPPEGWYEDDFGPEAACCASLLVRHPGGPEDGADAVQRILIKAGEEGGKAYETACRALHADWAERLRRGEPLPAVSRRYFQR